MESKEEMLKKLGLKTMFNISDVEMPELVDEYDIFMNHVAVLEEIDTEGIEPLAYPYEIAMLKVFKKTKLKYQRWWDNESIYNRRIT